jgi:hypothetical protein
VLKLNGQLGVSPYELVPALEPEDVHVTLTAATDLQVCA